MRDELERVILVNERDEEIGTEAKLAAHRSGVLHRAFSVFVTNGRGEMLLQRRAAGKYHSAGLWSNACCGHPRQGEGVGEAAARRLGEEMGFRCALRPAYSFVYRAELGEGLVEHELDHVFLGAFDGTPEPDAGEVSEWRWVAPDALRTEMARAPETFTPWFRMAVPELAERGVFAGAPGAHPRPAAR